MLLSRIQNGFRTLMLDHPRALENPPKEFAALFREGDIPLPERLKVYRNNIVGNLTDVLVNNHPLLLKLVGEDFLKGMARSYILAHPPKAAYLAHYAQDFDQFIAEFGPAQSLPYLADVARFEIAMNAAYTAPDDQGLHAEDLAKIPPETLADLKLGLRSGASLIQSRFPLLKIKEFCEQQEPEGNLDIAQGGVFLMVYRPALDVLTVILDKHEYMLLSALKDGQTLGDAAQGVLEAHPDFDFSAFLQRHISLESFSGALVQPLASL